MTQVIYIASTNKLKISAVRNVLADGDVRALDLPTDTDRPEQPVGYNAARDCAKSRIAAAVRLVNNRGPTRWIIAIENYVDHYKKEWWDAPMVIIADGSGNIMGEAPMWGRKSACSTHVPLEYAMEAQSIGPVAKLGWETTVGSVIHSHFPDIPANSWHSHYGKLDRQMLMCVALQSTVSIVTLRSDLGKKLQLYPDYPSPGILFRDMNPLLADSNSFQRLVTLIALYIPTGTTHIAGMESRGFILGAAVAFKEKLPFVPIRKPGKLPGKVHHAEYQKEYGMDALEVQDQLLSETSRVVIVDDVLATGGTAHAAVELVHACGAHVEHFIVVDHVPELLSKAKAKLGDTPFTVIL